jgi:phosphoglucosamine mutase
MSHLKFGTDGVRGKVNHSLKVEDVLALGRAHGYSLRQNYSGARRPRVVVGRDSRVSGDALQGAYGAGLMSQGVDLVDLGVLPTPGVAFAVRHLHAQGAAMISASHNPVPDNGIKLFGPTGKKLDDSQARDLEALVAQIAELPLPDGVALGRRSDAAFAVREAYHSFLLTNLEGRLKGMRVVLDCAFGAAAGHAREVFLAAGAEVVALCDDADGERINVACGSTDLSLLQAAVVEHQAALGLAFDGDADRCLAVTEKGEPVTGDQMMVVVANHLKAQGRLAKDLVVLTVMSNLGAELTLRQAGITVTRTQVGDRYVFEEMERSGAVLGGEQSGHVLLLDRHWSGDGIMAGLVFAGVVLQSERSVSDLVGAIPEMPQKLVNVAGVDKSRLETDPAVLSAIRLAEEQLGPEGRLLVRCSGTEPLVRLMAEGPDGARIDQVLETLRQVVVENLALEAAGF